MEKMLPQTALCQCPHFKRFERDSDQLRPACTIIDSCVPRASDSGRRETSSGSCAKIALPTHQLPHFVCKAFKQTVPLQVSREAHAEPQSGSIRLLFNMVVVSSAPADQKHGEEHRHRLSNPLLFILVMPMVALMCLCLGQSPETEANQTDSNSIHHRPRRLGQKTGTTVKLTLSLHELCAS